MEPLLNASNSIELEYEIKHLERTTKCGICGEDHSLTDCNFLTISNHIPDKIIPSKARLSLPDSLEIRKLSDGSFSVYAQCLIEAGTQFGPFQARKLFTLHPSIEFPLKIFTEGDEDLSEYFLDTSDENECSWMTFVSPANDIEEQNVICYQAGEHLYYASLRVIQPGESLKVWYSPYYAVKMKKELLGTDTCVANDFQIKPDIETLLKQKKNITARDSWSCKFCGKVEKELSVFSVHLLEHYRAQLSRSCGICNESFLSKLLLNKHLRLVHGNNPISLGDSTKNAQVSILKLKDENVVKETSVGGPLLLNDITPDSMDNSNLLLPQTDLSQFDLSGIENQNMLLENVNIDNILNENVKQLDHFNFEINIQETEQLICDICLKHFVKLKCLIQHLEQHTGKFFCHECNRIFARKENLLNHACKLCYKIKCPMCDKIFFQKKFLTHHIKAIHNRRYKCENCNKFYHSKRGLDNHNCSNIPTSKKEKFVCKICHQIFFKKSYLQSHMVRHSGKKEQSYVCAICNKILASKKVYARHLQLHDKRNYSYSCDICQKRFHRSDNLKTHKKQNHMEKDEAATCEICKKIVKTKRLLKIHLEIHKKEKPYNCEVCNATFKQRCNLTRHLNTHKSNKVRAITLLKDSVQFFICPKCNKKMTLRSSLSRHMKKLHPEYEMSCAKAKPKLAKINTGEQNNKIEPIQNDELVDDEFVLDLKQTIENMNFNTDEMNNCSESNEINLELEKILNNDNIDNLLCDSNDRIVESLISIAAEDNQLNMMPNQSSSKEVCLSMPDLSEGDQEIKLGENAYLLDNGNIVEEQDNSKVVVYVLDENKFT